MAASPGGSPRAPATWSPPAASRRSSRTVSPAGSAELSSTGAFTIPTLAPGSYSVCVVTNPASLPPYGYADECFQNVPWPEGLWGDIPSGTTPVVVASGADQVHRHHGVGAGRRDLRPGHRFARQPDDQGRLRRGLRPRERGRCRASQVDAQGSYTVIGLPASSTGYSVCFSPRAASRSFASTGQCYKGVAWNMTPPTPPARRRSRSRPAPFTPARRGSSRLAGSGIGRFGSASSAATRRHVRRRTGESPTGPDGRRGDPRIVQIQIEPADLVGAVQVVQHGPGRMCERLVLFVEQSRIPERRPGVAGPSVQAVASTRSA